MSTLPTLLCAIAASAAACMAHAAITGRWDMVRGGAPFAVLFGLAGLIVTQL
jgi:hypothetical protein